MIIRKRREIIQKAGLLIFSTILSLVVVELYLRVTTVRPEMKVGTTRTPKARLYGWAPVPDSMNTFLNPDTGEKRKVRINSQGWKDVDHTFDKPDGIVRILFLGDSFTFGMVPLEDLYTRRVEQKLTERGVTGVEVISMGVGSWGTDQELEALRIEGVKYDPDVVIYQFTENDLWNNMQPQKGIPLKRRIFLNKPFRYELREGKLARIDRRSDIIPEPHACDRWFRDFLLKSYVVYYLNLIRTSVLSGSAQMREMQHAINPNGSYKPDDGSPHHEKRWALLEALILEMRSVASKAGAKLVVFSDSGDEGLRIWNLNKGRIQNDGTTDYVMWKGEKYRVDTKRPMKELTRLCQRHLIPLINPVRTYERYRNDPHTNARGNDMMAEDIVDFLLSWDYFQRLLTSRYKPVPDMTDAE